MRKSIEQYYKAFNQICEDFVSEYYSYDDGSYSDYYIIGDGIKLAPNVVGIADDFWNIDQMYEALKNNIPKDKLFEWYEYSNNKAMIKQGYENLTTFVYGMKPYTEKDKKKDEARIKKCFKLLQDSINDKTKA